MFFMKSWQEVLVSHLKGPMFRAWEQYWYEENGRKTYMICFIHFWNWAADNQQHTPNQSSTHLSNTHIHWIVNDHWQMNEWHDPSSPGLSYWHQPHCLNESWIRKLGLPLGGMYQCTQHKRLFRWLYYFNHYTTEDSARVVTFYVYNTKTQS